MPKKRKTEAVLETAAVNASVPDAPKVIQEIKIINPFCGHINKQFYNKAGKQEDLACALPKGHTGDHFAKYVHLVTEYGTKKGADGVEHMVAVGSHEETTDGYWSDAAGEIPNPHIKTAEEDYASLKRVRDAERGVDSGLSEKIEKEVRSTYG